MSTLIDLTGTVHDELVSKNDERTMCNPLGFVGLTRSGKDVTCEVCVIVKTALKTYTGPRYDVFMNGSLMGGGSSFASGLASAVRVSLRYPERLFRLHDDEDPEQAIVEVRNGAITEVIVPF